MPNSINHNNNNNNNKNNNKNNNNLLAKIMKIHDTYLLLFLAILDFKNLELYLE